MITQTAPVELVRKAMRHAKAHPEFRYAGRHATVGLLDAGHAKNA